MESKICPDATSAGSQGLKGAAAPPTKPAIASKEAAAARKVGREFESMFVGMMLKSMRETVGKEGMTGGGHGEETYRGLLDQEYANAIAGHGGIGLAGIIEQQLLRQQGVTGQTATQQHPPVINNKGADHAD